jgi:hypothetical protein
VNKSHHPNREGDRLRPYAGQPTHRLHLTPSTRRSAGFLLALLVWVSVVVLTLAAGHAELLHRMPIFSGAQAITGVTEFLDHIRGYLLSIVLAGFTVAGVAVGAAKLSGHSRANDMLFNVGVGIAIFAALPTLIA